LLSPENNPVSIPPARPEKRAPASPPGRDKQPQDPVSRTYNESESKSKFDRSKRQLGNIEAKPSQGESTPVDLDRANRHEIEGDASGILSLGNRNLVDLALMANFEVLNAASSPTATMTTVRQGEPKEFPCHPEGQCSMVQWRNEVRTAPMKPWFSLATLKNPPRPVRHLKTICSRDVGCHAAMPFVRREPEIEAEAWSGTRATIREGMLRRSRLT
jgi:hypothetical protein